MATISNEIIYSSSSSSNLHDEVAFVSIYLVGAGKQGVVVCTHAVA